MEGKDLQSELNRLNIISFDCSGIATKADVLTAVSAIDNHLAKHSDQEIHNRIEELKKQKSARRFKAGSSE